jgi:predicted nuclease with RNAse H fold
VKRLRVSKEQLEKIKPVLEKNGMEVTSQHPKSREEAIAQLEQMLERETLEAIHLEHEYQSKLTRVYELEKEIKEYQSGKHDDEFEPDYTPPIPESYREYYMPGD